MIGSGSFGRCYRGVWHGAAVAVKVRGAVEMHCRPAVTRVWATRAGVGCSKFKSWFGTPLGGGKLYE